MWMNKWILFPGLDEREYWLITYFLIHWIVCWKALNERYFAIFLNDSLQRLIPNMDVFVAW